MFITTNPELCTSFQGFKEIKGSTSKKRVTFNNEIHTIHKICCTINYSTISIKKFDNINNSLMITSNTANIHNSIDP